MKQGGDPAATQLRLSGDDFETPDGTCIRDTIHVADLCRAHLLAGARLMAQRVAAAEAYNLGIGKGFSVKEVIDVCRKVTGVPIEYAVVGRRPGDPPRLVGNADRACRELGWTPEYVDLVSIVETAWRYMEARRASGAAGVDGAMNLRPTAETPRG